MYFIGSGDGDGRIDGHIWNCYPNDALVIAFEILDLCFREKTHQINDLKFKNIPFESPSSQLNEVRKYNTILTHPY